ncbi:MAG: hypothetical protein EBQ92_13280 [Proteobacteria bacterium]|nr:hypothetical protein [Pseudomonadota bacterium]
MPLAVPRLGFQLGVSTLSYDSRFSTQGSLYWDTKLVEVGVRASGRVLGSLGIGRTSLDNTLQEWSETYSVEIGRRFLSPDGRFGRIGIELDEFSPKKERFIHFAMDTGILDAPNEPGTLKLSFHLFRPMQSGSDTRLTSSIDVGHVVSQGNLTSMKLGLMFGWTYHLSQEQGLSDVNALSDKFLRSEHMIFAASPWVEYSAPAFVARLSVPFRLFMDKQWQSKNDVLVTSYPFAYSSPDIFASIVFLL